MIYGGADGDFIVENSIRSSLFDKRYPFINNFNIIKASMMGALFYVLCYRGSNAGCTGGKM